MSRFLTGRQFLENFNFHHKTISNFYLRGRKMVFKIGQDSLMIVYEFFNLSDLFKTLPLMLSHTCLYMLKQGRRASGFAFPQMYWKFPLRKIWKYRDGIMLYKFTSQKCAPSLLKSCLRLYSFETRQDYSRLTYDSLWLFQTWSKLFETRS